MSIRRKLHVALGTMIGLVLVIAGVGLWSTASSRAALKTLAGEYTLAEAVSMEISLLVEKALSEERAIVIRAILADRSGMQVLESSYRQSRASLAEGLASLQRINAGSPQAGVRRGLIAEIEALTSTWDDRHRRFWESAQQSKPEETAALVRAELVPLGARLGEKTKQLFDNERKATQGAAAEATAAGQRHSWLLLLVAALTVLASGSGWWLVNQAITELGKSLIDMKRMAEEVTQAAGSVSNTSQALAVGTTRQAASTEETAASATEVKSMAQRNSESAREAARIVTDAQEKFDGAHHALGRMEDTMGGIEASASKIARIIKVIDDIAFQTNILSLNAAVEAARAGDAGMGFAVVADEVRGLAQRCATAAQETAALINESISRSAEGKLVAAEVAGTIRAITTETLSIRTLVDEVSAGSEDQARALDQISSAIGQIERVTQDSAANAEEAAAASEELTAQAAELRLIAQRLTLLTGGPADEIPVSRSYAKTPAASVSSASGLSARAASQPQRPTSAMATFDDDQDFRPF